MSNLLTEINRMRDLMGIKTPINESLLHNKILLKEGTGIGEIMDIYKSIFKKGAVELTEEESNYLKNLVDEYNLRFPNSKIEFVNGLDNLSFRKLSDFITKQGDEILNDFFGSLSKNIYRKEISELGIKGFLSLDQAFRNLMKSEKIINGLTDSSGEVISIYDHINYIYQKGGIKNSDLPDSILTVLKDELEYLIKDPKKLGSLSNDDPFKKYCSDIVSQIDETQNGTVIKVDPEIPLKVKEIQDSIPLNKTNIDDISTKLKSLSDSDQTMRQGDDMDIDVDINNQVELKKLMGDDKENFIKNLNTLEDLENLWVIVQHSDNDLEFQKEILKILQNNQQTIETKFSTNSQEIKMGIAMLEDRVMVNTNTSVVGYRDTGMEDFGDLINGKQKYGTQGGVNENGEWIPRPIELDGEIYFFESPQRLIDDVEFLNKLNEKRSVMGLGSMEDYLKKMNKTDNFIDDFADEVIQIEVKGNDKIVYDIFGKNGIYFSEGINLIRNLGDKFLKDYKKLYVEGASKQEIEEYLKGLELLKSKFGDKKIYTTPVEGGKNTKKMTLDEFINDVKNNYKRIYDENGDWSPLNKLDTNYKDNPLELTTFIKTILTKDEYDVFVKKIQDYNNAIKDSSEKLKLKNELDKEFENIKLKLEQNEKYIKNWINRVDDITKNIKKNTAVGDFSEQKVNELFEKNGLKVEYTASNGSPIDVLLSVDQIINDTKNIFGGGIKTVQTKTATKIEEGEFEIIGGKRTNNWIPKKGTGTYKVEMFKSQKVAKQSQTDLSGFYDPNSNITIITGKQKGLEKTVDNNGKTVVTYNLDGTPVYSNSMELPGSVLYPTKYPPIGTFIIDAETTKIVGR